MLETGGEHSIYVSYKQPMIFRISQLISLLTVAAGAVFAVRKRKRRKAEG